MQRTIRRPSCAIPNILALAGSVLALAGCDAGPSPETSAADPDPIEVVALEEPEPFGPAAQAAADALAELLLNPDPYARARGLGELLPTLGPDAVPGVEKALRDRTLKPGGAEIELLTWFWAEHEPHEASEWAVNESPSGYRIAAALAAITQWAKVDPHASNEAIGFWEIMRADVREVVRIAQVRGWYRRDPAEAGENIRSMTMGFGRQRAIATYVRLMMRRQGPEAAMRWAESVPDDDETSNRFKLQVYRQVAAALPLFDKHAARRWCEDHCEGPYGRDLRQFIAARWVQIDGVEALEWIASHEPGEARDAAVENTYAEWTRADRDRSLAWMAAQIGEDGAEMPLWLRPALASYALVLSIDRPVEAFEWGQRIEDEEERENTLVRIAKHWRTSDAAGFEAWLGGASHLSEELLGKITGNAAAEKPAPSSAPED